MLQHATRLLLADLDNQYFRTAENVAVNGLAGYANYGWRCGKYKTPITPDEMKFICVDLFGLFRRTKATNEFGEEV